MVYQTKRICKRHFAKEWISARGHLYTTAVPELFIQKPTQDVSVDHSYCVGEDIEVFGKQSSKVTFERNYCIGKDHIEKACIKDNEAVPSTSGVFPEFPSTSGFYDAPTQFKKVGNLRKTKKSVLVGKTTAAAIKKHEFRKIRKYISTLKSRHSSLRQSIKIALNTANMTLYKEMNRWSRIVLNFFNSQTKNLKKRKLGRRFSLEDKLFALALYERSGKCYRFLSNIFALPSRKIMMTLLNKVKLDPGLNPFIISLFQKAQKN